MSSEYLIEHGIGEIRAVRVEAGQIVELHIEREGIGLRAGDVREARLAKILVPGKRGIVAVGSEEALIEPLRAGVTEGGRLFVEVLREAIPEAGRAKLAKVRTADGPARDGPTLIDRLAAGGAPLREAGRPGPDWLEEAGWSEAIDEAATGVVPFDGGVLTISPTPAMTVIDVDGALPPTDLAIAGAAAAARAVRRLGITGSIGVDLPTVGDKLIRQRAGEAIDAALPQPFERTAVNGFGFVQIVRPRLRASIIELIQGEPAATAALALLRRAERAGGIGERTLVAAPGVIAWLAARPPLTDELARRIGAAVALRAEAGLAISAGHVDVRHS